MFTENKKKFLIIVRVAEIFMRKSKYIIILEELIEKNRRGRIFSSKRTMLSG